MDSDVDQKNLPDREMLAAWARESGFQQIGITDIDLSEHSNAVKHYLAQKFHGDMGYLERNLERRLNPDALLPQTIRVISARMNYLAADTRPLHILEHPDKAYISRYALGRDYHKVLRKRLARLATRIDTAVQGFAYRAFTDSAPVLEKAFAGKAGLGWMGKHTLMLDKQAGSWFFIGEIFTSAPLSVDPTPSQTLPISPASDSHADPCGKCTACLTVCPTDAIISPRVLDARRCISYLTIEHHDAIPENLRAAIGNRVFGCDDCQLFCPWNREAQTTSEQDFAPRHNFAQANLLDLFALSEKQFLELTEGSALRRISFEQWQRNLSVALGNGPTGDEVISALKKARPQASAMVAEHIDWALQRLLA